MTKSSRRLSSISSSRPVLNLDFCIKSRGPPRLKYTTLRRGSLVEPQLPTVFERTGFQTVTTVVGAEQRRCVPGELTGIQSSK